MVIEVAVALAWRPSKEDLAGPNLFCRVLLGRSRSAPQDAIEERRKVGLAHIGIRLVQFVDSGDVFIRLNR